MALSLKLYNNHPPCVEGGKCGGHQQAGSCAGDHLTVVLESFDMLNPGAQRSISIPHVQPHGYVRDNLALTAKFPYDFVPRLKGHRESLIQESSGYEREFTSLRCDNDDIRLPRCKRKPATTSMPTLHCSAKLAAKQQSCLHSVSPSIEGLGRQARGHSSSYDADDLANTARFEHSLLPSVKAHRKAHVPKPTSNLRDQMALSLKLYNNHPPCVEGGKCGGHQQAGSCAGDHLTVVLESLNILVPSEHGQSSRLEAQACTNPEDNVSLTPVRLRLIAPGFERHRSDLEEDSRCSPPDYLTLVAGSLDMLGPKIQSHCGGL